MESEKAAPQMILSGQKQMAALRWYPQILHRIATFRTVFEIKSESSIQFSFLKKSTSQGVKAWVILKLQLK